MFARQSCLNKFLCVITVTVFIGSVFLALPKFSIAQKTTKIVSWQLQFQPHTIVMEKLYKAFQEENPDIEVDIHFIPWAAYFDKLFISIATGTGPDLAKIPMGLAEKFIQSGNIIPLEISVEEAKRDFIPWTIERLIVEDEVWGLPADVNNLMLMYNERLIREAGFDMSKPPVDWDELVEWTKKLTKRKADGTILQMGMRTGYYSAVLEHLFFQAGAFPMYDETRTKALFDGSNAGALKALTYLTDFTTKHKSEDRYFQAQENFAYEKVAISAGHPVSVREWEIRNPDLEVALAMWPPVHSTDEPISFGMHWQWVIAKKAPEEATNKWINWLVSEEAQIVFSEISGDMVSRKALIKSPKVRKTPNQIAALDTLPYLKPMSWIGWAKQNELYTGAIERVIHGEANPKESLDILAQKVTEFIAQTQ